MKITDEKISAGLAKTVPSDRYSKIEKAIDSVPRENKTEVILMKKKNNIIRILLPAVAAFVIVLTAFFGIRFYNTNMITDSIIDIDVNPGIELLTNKKDRVIDVRAINDDAVEILDGMKLKSTDLKVAVNAIVGSMVQKGYVTDEMSSILITVKNDDSKKADTLRADIVKSIDDTLNSHDIKAPVINQTLTDGNSHEAFAKEHSISFGKAVFVKNIASKDSSLDAAELAKLSISELTKLVIEKKIDISDIADYDHDDSILENISDSIEETNEKKEEEEKIDALNKDNPSQQSKPQQDGAQQNSYLSKEQVKAAVLAHAKINQGDVRGFAIEFDRDDGREVYEVEFYSQGYEYEYEVDAVSGEILHSSKEFDD